jgi:AraC-like DNA-binding protein
MKAATPPAAADEGDTVARVRAELALGAAGYPDLPELAARLHTSSRTLKRRLARHGSGFQILLDQARHRDALRLLRNPDLEIRQIAAVLGYKDPPSFTRAFRRWTGQTPHQARAAQA